MNHAVLHKHILIEDLLYVSFSYSASQLSNSEIGTGKVTINLQNLIVYLTSSIFYYYYYWNDGKEHPSLTVVPGVKGSTNRADTQLLRGMVEEKTRPKRLFWTNREDHDVSSATLLVSIKIGSTLHSDFQALQLLTQLLLQIFKVKCLQGKFANPKNSAVVAQLACKIKLSRIIRGVITR